MTISTHSHDEAMSMIASEGGPSGSAELRLPERMASTLHYFRHISNKPAIVTREALWTSPLHSRWRRNRNPLWQRQSIDG